MDLNRMDEGAAERLRALRRRLPRRAREERRRQHVEPHGIDLRVVQLSADGRRVTNAIGLFDLKCKLGGFLFESDRWARLPVSAAGRFSGSVTDQAEKFSDGSEYRITASISAGLAKSGRTGSGRWRVQWKLDNNGQPDVCDSGTVKFKLAR